MDSDGSETVQLRVGLEPTSQDSNLAKTQTGTWMQSLNWDHIWSQDLKKLSFFMSLWRKNSVSNKVIGKK